MKRNRVGEVWTFNDKIFLIINTSRKLATEHYQFIFHPAIILNGFSLGQKTYFREHLHTTWEINPEFSRVI